MRTVTHALTLTPLLALPLAAQSGPPEPVDVPAPWADAVGLEVLDGRTIAAGPRWKASFEAGGFLFTPALGAEAPRNEPLGWSLTSIERGGETVWRPAGAPLPTIDAERATYARAGGVLEHYDVLPEGIEQSFELPTELGTAGELVIRGRLTTDLVPERTGASHDGLGFRTDDRAAVRVGEVFALDADGERVEGWLRTDGEFLDLVVPASFVDGARWPLTVDPIIGPDYDVATGAVNVDAEMAFDATSDLWLIAWTTQFSVLDFDIRGRKLRANQTFASGVQQYESESSIQAFQPAVGNVNLADRFLVVWTQNTGLFTTNSVVGRSVGAGVFGATGAKVAISSLGVSCSSPTVSSEPTLVDDDALVVYQAAGLGLRGNQVQLTSASSTATVLATVTITTVAGDSAPAISPTGGPNGTYLLVWERQGAGSTAQRNIIGRVFDRNLGGLTLDTAIAADSEYDEFSPDVDGDGEEYLVVYDRTFTPLSLESSIAGRCVALAPIVLDVGAEHYYSSSKYDLPTVAWSGYDYMVTTIIPADDAPGDSGAVIVEWVDRLDYEDDYGYGEIVGIESGFYPAPVSSPYQGDLTPRKEAVVVWTADDGADGQYVNARFHESGFYVDDLGLSCGTGGEAITGIPRVGLDVKHRVVDASPNSIALFTVGFSRLDFPCGPCVFVPNTMAPGFIDGTVTGLDGSAELSTPIPDNPVLVGLKFWTQWAIAVDAPACGLLGVDVSTALEHEVF